ncbi:MAG: Mini-ribonuclease 3 [Cyanobacteria bacterium J069]|nr:MAG: ribonuclease III [Cyanobacteria bacterium J069]
MPSGPDSGSSPPTEQDLQRLSPAALAYVGDAVYELHVRVACLLPPRRIQDYHQQVVGQVRAESQAAQVRSLFPYLTEPEQEIVRRGRNAAQRGPRRVDADIYRQASGLEALLGYLYFSNPARLNELLQRLQSFWEGERSPAPVDLPHSPNEVPNEAS